MAAARPGTARSRWVPLDIQNWWHYQASIYGYHVDEHTPHAYQANPFGWLFLLRPTSMYWHANGNSAETILGACQPADLVGGYGRDPVPRVPAGTGPGRLRQRVTTEAFILSGMAAGYLPWLLIGRTVFQFYTIAFEPFLVLALVAAIALLLGSPRDPEGRRVAGLRAVGTFLVLCVALSLFFLPIWTGAEIPRWYMTLHFWFPSWI